MSTSTSQNMRDRDSLIRSAHTFAFVPKHFSAVLVRVNDNRAVRMLTRDALAIARTADFSTVVRRTVHRNRSAETLVTDYYWSDGMRVRITETFAM